MKRLIYLYCLLFFSTCLFGGDNLDSLKRIAKITKDDTLRIQILKTVGEEEGIFRIGYWDSLRIECELKLENCPDSKKLFFQKYRSLFINNVGYVADEQGDLKLALESYKKSAEICKEINDRIGYSKALNNIGSVYDNIGDVGNSIDYYHRSLKIREEIKDEKGVAVCLNNIGFIFYKQKDFDKALKYYYSGLKILLKIKNEQLSAISYNNIGLIHLNRKNYAYALMYFQKARTIQIKLGDAFNLSQSTSNLASLYEAQNNFELALKFYEENLVLQEQLNYKKGIAVTLGNIARVYLKIGKTNEALDKAKQALEIIQGVGIPDYISSTSLLLSQIYEKQGNYKGAFTMHVLHKKMSDSLSSSENKKASLQKELQYEYDKKVAADSLKIEASKKITEAKFEKEKTQRYALYGGVFVLICVAIFIFNRLQITQKQNLIIENQKMEVELKNEEITHQKELLEEKQKEIIDSINYASRIQNAVSTGISVWENISKDYFVLYQPKDIVSGDFYWAHVTAGNKCIWAAADCTGHGVPGAFMSVLGNTLLNQIVIEQENEAAAEILNELRKKVILALDKNEMGQNDGIDIALCVWDKLTNSLEFAGANNGALLVRNKETIELKPNKMPIGKYHGNVESFTSTIIQLQKNDVIFLYTDGMADQFGGPLGKKFRYKQLDALLVENSDKQMSELKQILFQNFVNWKGNLGQTDDVCVIGIRV